jgi:hypothetical protein
MILAPPVPRKVIVSGVESFSITAIDNIKHEGGTLQFLTNLLKPGRGIFLKGPFWSMITLVVNNGRAAAGGLLEAAERDKV